MPSNRQTYFAESNAESTWNTDTNYQDKVTLTFTPDDNSTYLILASWIMRESNTTYRAFGKLTRTSGTPKDFNEVIYYPKDTTDYLPCGCVTYETFGASPGSQTYKIQYKTSSTSGTVWMKEARIFALKLVSADQYNQSEARETTTQITMQTKVSKIFTPASQDDYIILASATLDEASNSYDWKGQLLIDAAIYTLSNIEPVWAPSRYFWGLAVKVNLTQAEHTIAIQYCTGNAGAAAGVAHANIVILRADEFFNVYSIADETRTTTTLTTYQNKVTLTQTVEAQPHLILGSAGFESGNTTYSGYCQLLGEDSVSRGEAFLEAADSTSRNNAYISIYKKTLAAQEYSWYMQWKTENAIADAGINGCRIIALQLEGGADISRALTGVSATG